MPLTWLRQLLPVLWHPQHSVVHHRERMIRAYFPTCPTPCRPFGISPPILTKAPFYSIYGLLQPRPWPRPSGRAVAVKTIATIIRSMYYMCSDHYTVYKRKGNRSQSYRVLRLPHLTLQKGTEFRDRATRVTSIIAPSSYVRRATTGH